MGWGLGSTGLKKRECGKGTEQTWARDGVTVTVLDTRGSQDPQSQAPRF